MKPAVPKNHMRFDRVHQEFAGKFNERRDCVSFTPCFSWVVGETDETNEPFLSVFVALPKPLKRLMSDLWPSTTTQLKQGVNESPAYKVFGALV